MGMNRRKFLKIAGISTLGMAANPAADVLAIEWLDEKLGGFTIPETLFHLFHKPTGFKPAEALTAKQWAMVVVVREMDEEIAQAAGEIHTDFEKGFIRAETISYEDYVALGGEHGARDAGKLRLEGKDYIVKEGDVMHFRFNV